MRKPTTQKLRERRDEKGYTQIQLAKMAGITDRTLKNYEAGRRFPDIPTAGALAEALHTTVDELFFN